MASSHDLVFGQIGAAKIFCGRLSSSLEINSSANRQNMERLEEQISQTNDEKQIARLSKAHKKLEKKQNTIINNTKKINSAIDYLSELAEKVDLGKDEIIEYLSKFIVTVLPSLETTIKVALLANIKKMTSCALDASIPDKLRSEGMLINESEIDPRHILLVPPISKYGHYQYFGVDTPGISSFELAKAEDMNAFIWFVKNCAKFVSPLIIWQGAGCNAESYFKGDVEKLYNGNYEGFMLKETSYMAWDANDDGKKQLVPGTLLKDYTSSETLYIITNISYHEGYDGETIKWYDVKAISNDQASVATSVNWYKSNTNKPKAIKKPKPLLSLQYSNVYNSSAKLPLNNFKFKILPKPFMMGSSIIADLGNNINETIDDLATLNYESIEGSGLTKENLKQTISNYKKPIIGSVPPKKALFDFDGKYNPNGVYTIDENRFYVINTTRNRPVIRDFEEDEIVSYKLEPKDESGISGWLIYNKLDDNFNLYDINGNELANHPEITKYITICYNGRTVYEFNYDYIMSFKLFDAKVIAANVINSLLSIDLPISPESIMKSLLGKKQQTADSYNQAYINTMINRMIQKMLDSESEEYTSCFYTFSNDEYINMEAETALKVINGQLFKEETANGLTSAYDILKAYNADASLHEQTEVIIRSITKALESSSDNSVNSLAFSTTQGNNHDASTNGLQSFIKNTMQALIRELTYSLLSPKVLMLIAVNKKLMHDEAIDADNKQKYEFTYKDVLGGIQGIIVSVVKEVIDAVEKEVLRVILGRITEIFNGYLKTLGREYADKWRTFLKSLLSCFSFSSTRLKQGYYDNELTDAINESLNNVDYADLDELAGQIIPDTKPC